MSRLRGGSASELPAERRADGGAAGTRRAGAASAPAAVQLDASARRGTAAPVLLTASLSSGWIEGVVTDDRSRPIGGAAVTAQGRDFLLVETDGTGRFSIRSVPAGTYLLRVQGRGFSAVAPRVRPGARRRAARDIDVRLRRAADVDPAPGEARVHCRRHGAQPGDAPARLRLEPAPPTRRRARRGASRTITRRRPGACVISKRSVLRD